jgi:hypothetical protein
VSWPRTPERSRDEQLGSLERSDARRPLQPATRIRQGDTIEVALDESALHFFDPSTGEAI